MYLSKKRITELFGELLSEVKGFKYQITLFVILSKLDGAVEYAAVYLNSFVKAVIMILMIILIKVLVKFCLGSIIGSMKDLDGLLKD